MEEFVNVTKSFKKRSSQLFSTLRPYFTWKTIILIVKLRTLGVKAIDGETLTFVSPFVVVPIFVFFVANSCDPKVWCLHKYIEDIIIIYKWIFSSQQINNLPFIK